MHTKNTAEIDFDTWSELAKTDPGAFEALRLEAIEAVIASAPEANRERLRRLQWRIDQERRLARTPMAACVRISRMMWRSLLGPNGLHERISEQQQMVAGNAPASQPTSEPVLAEVVAIRRAAD